MLTLFVATHNGAEPEPDWLLQLRTAADAQPDYAVFGGRILPLWQAEPEEWLLQWLRGAPAYGITDAALPEGLCKATQVPSSKFDPTLLMLLVVSL